MSNGRNSFQKSAFHRAMNPHECTILHSMNRKSVLSSESATFPTVAWLDFECGGRLWTMDTLRRPRSLSICPLRRGKCARLSSIPARTYPRPAWTMTMRNSPRWKSEAQGLRARISITENPGDSCKRHLERIWAMDGKPPGIPTDHPFSSRIQPLN